ncbi:MAG: hypothetical protein ACK5NG_12070, partial [Chthoniobacterales bacterium]
VVIIAALAIPAISKSKATASSAKCISQLRKIHTSMMLYIQDNNNEFPPANSSVAPWTGLWYNPSSNPQDSVIGFSNEDSLSFQRLTVCPMNTSSSPATAAKNQYGYPYVCNYEVMRQQGSSLEPVRIFTISNPSRVFLLADSGINNDWGLGVLSTSVGASSWARLREAHNGKINVLWVDGHITSEKKFNITKDNVAF